MLRLLALGLGVATTAAAQEVIHQVTSSALGVDSGYLANPSAAPRLLWSADVAATGDWLQLHCRDSNLPAGSRLRLCAPARPTAVQWHDAFSLLDYDGWSCAFVGPSVHVELWGAPNSTGNRVWLDVVRGVTFFPGGNDSICDLVDDRVLSNDPRACRLGAGCSAWLFSEYAVGTAGHCMNSGSTSGVLLHFNVPPSSSTGVPQPSAPDDQYALGPFLQYLDNGIGQDWATMAALRNSNTQLFPGQAQGAWYTVGSPPAAANATLRVTGYGTGNGTSGSPTASQMQKTHTGPRAVASAVDAVAYRVDTTGGNSGSPVLDEGTGELIAVHTHSGCTNGSGQNEGTATTRTDFAAARQAVLALHTVGGFQVFGQGCGGPSGPPLLSFGGVPELGRSFVVRVTNLNPTPGLFGILAVGFSATQWPAGALPASLAPWGLSGCTLYVSSEGIDGMMGSNGISARSYFVPNSPGWLGARLHYQYFGLDPTAANPVGAVVSNGGTVRLGN